MTVNVLKASSYSLTFAGASSNPADATTYYYGSLYSLTQQTTAGINRVYVPVAGTIIACAGMMTIGGTPGSSETSTLSLRLNDTTDTTITTTFTADNLRSLFSNTALSIAVAALDYLELKWVTPTWITTNPTSVIPHMTVVVEV